MRKLRSLPRPLYRNCCYQVFQHQIRRLVARQCNFHEVCSSDMSSPCVGKLVSERKWQNNRCARCSQRGEELLNTFLVFSPSMLYLFTCESLCHAIV